jgi:hypothetical protein
MFQKHIILLAFAIAVVGCGGTKKVPAPPPSPQPDWVKSRPTSQNYYHGIGVARKTYDVNQYQQAARQNALADMSAEISVSISSNSAIHAFQTNLNLREDFTSTILAQTQQDLEGYELVGAWEDAENYWVYYKLSKSLHLQLKEEKKKNAIIRSVDFYGSGIEARDAGNIRLALVQLVKALEPIKPYFSEPLPVNFRDTQIFLGNEIFKEISATLSGIEIVPINSEVMAKMGQSIGASALQFQVRFRNNANVAEFPLVVTYSEKPIRNNRKRSERNGIASFDIENIRSTKSFETLTATIDIDEILSEATPDPMIRRLVSRFNVPQGSIRISIQKLVFVIISSEVNIETIQNPGILQESFRKKAVEAGYIIKDNMNDADYVIRIEAHTRASGVSGAYKNATVTGNISVENAQGNQIYHKPLEGFTGKHFELNEAGLEALKEVRRRLEISFFREIQESISKK